MSDARAPDREFPDAGRPCGLRSSAEMRHGYGAVQVRDFVEQHRRQSDAACLLRSKAGRRVCRLRSASGETMILKLFPAPPWPSRARVWVHLARIRRERILLDWLADLGIDVPRVLGCASLPGDPGGFAYAKILEDFGAGLNGVEYVRQRADQGQDNELTEFEDRVIELTCRLIRLGVFDSDHSIINHFVTESGRVTRLDLDHARLLRWPRRGSRSYGWMIGRLVATYVFSVQPDLDRASAFAQRLTAELDYGAAGRRRAEEHVQALLDVQRDKRSIDSRIAWSGTPPGRRPGAPVGYRRP